MTEAQRKSLANICERYKVPFNEADYLPAFDLPEGYVAGWVGGNDHAAKYNEETGNRFGGTIYVGCSPQGEISS